MVNYYYLMINGKVTQTCFFETHTHTKPFWFDQTGKHPLTE